MRGSEDEDDDEGVRVRMMMRGNEGKDDDEGE